MRSGNRVTLPRLSRLGFHRLLDHVILKLQYGGQRRVLGARKVLRVHEGLEVH
jgi:hypothetical protein